MQYAEITAHNCKSVLVPGVDWPDPIEPPPSKTIISLRSLSKSKKIEAVLAAVNRLGCSTTMEIFENVDCSLSHLMTTLRVLTDGGFIDATKTNEGCRRWRFLYSKKEDTCKLH